MVVCRFSIFQGEEGMAFTQEDTAQRVIKIIEEKLSIPTGTVSLSATFKDLGADSLDIVELIMSFEEAFGIEIKDEDAEAIETVQNVVDHIHSARIK